MLRKVLLAPRHFLEHFVGDLACNISTPTLLSSRSRWHAVAATSPQYTVSHHVCLQENHLEENTAVGSSTYPSLQTQAQHKCAASHQLATIGRFLRYYGHDIQSALRYMQSDPAIFSDIHSLLTNKLRLYGVANRFAASPAPVRSVHLLHLAAAYGCTLNARLYESICWKLANSSSPKRWKFILEVYNLAQVYLSTSTLRLMHWRVRALCETQDFASLDNILQECKDAGVTPSRQTYHWILTGYLRNRNLAGARLCLTLMEDAGFPPDATTHSVVALNYRPIGLDAQVEHQAISNLHSLPEHIATRVVNQLMQDHIDFKDESGFRRLLRVFDQSAIAPIWSLLDQCDFNVSQSIKLSQPLHPNLTTFLIAIRFFISRSEFAAATAIFRHLRKQGCRCTPGILAAYLDLQFAANRFDYAISVSAKAMAKQKILDKFVQLSQGSMRYDDYQIQDLPILGKHGVEPRIDIFHALLRGSLKARGLNAAHTILEMMSRTCIQPDSRILEILVSHLISVEGVSVAKAFHILRQVSFHIPPTLRVSYAIINRFLHENKCKIYPVGWNQAEYSSERKHPPNYQKDAGDPHGPFAGLETTISSKYRSLSRNLVKSLASRQVQSDSTIMGIRIRHEALIKRDMAAAITMYSDMLARGLTPSEYHIAALMEGFAYQGDMEKALELMQATRHYNINPNVVLYTIVLHGYARHKKPKSAMQLFRRMIANGIRPDIPAIDALCSALFTAHNRWLAKKLLVSLWPYIQPFPRGYKSFPLKQLVETFRCIEPSAKFTGRLSTKERIRLGWLLSRITRTFNRCFEQRGRSFDLRLEGSARMNRCYRKEKFNRI